MRDFICFVVFDKNVICYVIVSGNWYNLLRVSPARQEGAGQPLL